MMRMCAAAKRRLADWLGKQGWLIDLLLITAVTAAAVSS
jgi:hypothetical protein